MLKQIRQIELGKKSPISKKCGGARAGARTRESEKTLEARLRREVECRGGLAVKHSSQFHRGMPDRILLLPGGSVIFVEVKSTGEKPTTLQIRAHEQLRALGFPVCVIDNTEDLESLCEAMDNLINIYG